MKQRLTVLQKLAAAAVLACAFIFMASVFSPQRTRAGDPYGSPRPVEPAFERFSANPHEGLRSLGVLEAQSYRVHIYATSDEPRYSIYEQATGRELGALLTAEQVHAQFPELQLPNADFSADDATTLMLADPEISER